MKLQEVTLFENKTHRILNEGYETLTETQKHVLGRFETELWPLLEDLKTLFEQNLTPQQIQAIFTNAEQVAMDSGANRTGLGKAGDAVAAGAKLPRQVLTAVNDKVNELGKLAKNSGPVQNADQKFRELKQKIAAENPDNKIVKAVQQVSDWAKENPGKATLAVGILTATASILTGPGGGAAAGFLLRSTKDLLQGEDLSTATGQALKTAAIGALVGVVADQVGGFFQGARAEVIDAENFARVDYGASKTLSAPGFRWTETIQGVNVKVTPEDAELVQDLMSQVGSGGNEATSAFNELSDLATKIKSDEYKDALAALGAEARNNDSLYQFITAAKKGITGLVQGTAAASGGKKESLEAEYDAYLAEGPFGNITSKAAGLMKTGATKTKAAASAGAQAVATKTAPMRKELGNKVTQKKLMTAWNDLGKPTDIGSIYNILYDAGLDKDLIQAVSVQSDVKLTPTASNKQAPKVNLKKLAAEIKAAGLNDVVKQQLAKPAPKVKKSDPAGLQARGDRARAMKPKKVS